MIKIILWVVLLFTIFFIFFFFCIRSIRVLTNKRQRIPKPCNMYIGSFHIFGVYFTDYDCRDNKQIVFFIESNCHKKHHPLHSSHKYGNYMVFLLLPSLCLSYHPCVPKQTTVSFGTHFTIYFHKFKCKFWYISAIRFFWYTLSPFSAIINYRTAKIIPNIFNSCSVSPKINYRTFLICHSHIFFSKLFF